MANFTRKEIKNAFVKLLNERRYSDITIRDIVEECGISRSAFYYHYQDIPSLIEEIIRENTDLIIAKHRHISSLAEYLTEIKDFVIAHKVSLLHIYRSVERGRFESQVMRTCDYIVVKYINECLGVGRMTETEREEFIKYHKFMFFGFAIDWFEHGLKPEALDSFIAFLGSRGDVFYNELQPGHMGL